jgi:hypothetical protein
MMLVRRLGSTAVGLACALALAGCGDKNDASSPTPVTTPNPSPAAGPTFSVSGTVFESAPTTSTRVPEAEVQLNGGAAYGTGSDGTFTIPNVANGTYTLNIRKAGFNSQTVAVTVAGANVTGLTANLQPVARIVDVIQDRSTSRNRNECANSRACEVVTIASHNNGESRFFVAWNNMADELDLEWWCNGVRLARSELNGIGADEVKPAIVAGQTCDLRIINATNSTFAYTLYLTYPY